MKRVVPILMVLCLCVGLCACTPANSEPQKPTEPQKPQKVWSNKYVTVEGMYVDNSFVDDNGSPLKMLYVFLDIDATDKNLEVDCKYVNLRIGGTNSYESTFYKGACELMPSYYYSSFVEDVYIGDSIKLALTFKVPSGDLVPGKKITFSDIDIPFSDIQLSTDDIRSRGSVEAIAKEIDATGYQTIQQKREPADYATETKVKKELNGYYFTFYVTVGTQRLKYEIEFASPNYFEIRSPLGTNQGTYDVRNSYIFCTYPSNGETIEIEYEFGSNGEIGLGLSKAFSVYE